MNTIVVGFDGSEEGLDGLRLGSRLAEGMDAKLVVAAAFGPGLSAPAVDLKAVAHGYFHNVFAQAERALGGSEFERRELMGVSAPRGLAELAEREGADLVVIGSSHRGAVGRIVFGSVGERLLNGAPCAVAVAPRGYAGGAHIGLGLIGVGFDGSTESELALDRAKQLATALDGELRLITVIPELSVGAPAEPTMKVDADAYREASKRALRELGSLPVEEVVEEGDPPSVLVRNGVDMDLLVIGSRGYGPVRRTLLGGVSAEVMRTAPCPVVVVPRGAAGQ